MIVPAGKLLSRSKALLSGPIARASIMSVIIRMFGLALTFAATALAARMLGAEGYGMAAFALSVAQIAATVALLGYNSLAIREISRRLKAGQTAILRRFVRKASLVVLICALVLSALVMMFAIADFEVLSGYQTVLIPAAIAIPFLAAIQLFRGITQGFGQSSSAQWPGDIIRPLILALAMLGYLMLGQNLSPPWFLIIYAATACAAAGVGGFIVLQKIRSLSQPLAGKQTDAGSNHENLTFFGLALITVIFAEFATLMLGIFASAEAAGLFQPIARLTPLMTIPIQAAAMRFAPRVSELWEGDEHDRLRGITRSFTVATSLLTACVGLGIAISGPWILAAFGPEFVSAAPLLWIIAAGQIFSALCGPLGYLLTMTGHTRIALQCQLAGLVAALAMGAWLIPSSGPLGAAIALTCGIVVWNSALLVVARKRLGFNPSISGVLLDRR